MDDETSNFTKLFALSAAQATELQKLHDAIKLHHDQTVGHNMCWENDVELWKAVGIDEGYGETPPWAEFMTKCAEYRASRECPRTTK